MNFSDVAVTAGCPSKPLYSVSEVVHVLGVSKSAVYRAIKSGELRSKKAGRLYVRGEWVDEWLDS